ncbi:MAG TPA: septum site-determining protein MinC [Symbiobacteriaceae bacterium]|jgi:septum site-determining protein MinC
MRQDIVIRGTTKTGLVIVLPDDMEFGKLMGRLREKLANGAKFFQGAEVTIHVGSRVLSEEERVTVAGVLGEANMTLRGIHQGGDPFGEAHAARTQPVAAALQPELQTALVVNRTLRSGQSVRHEGDVIVLGDVNPGAEVVASGHIVVMGALRGVAHAGCTGNTAALVAASKLRPTQLRIAHVIGRAPDIQEDLQPIPEVARVQDGMIVVETPTESKR